MARVLVHRDNRRVARGVLSGTGAFLQTFGKAFHLLWLEVTGFVFLCFGVIAGFALIREYPGVRAGTVSQGRFGVTLLISLMFLWFGISSFWRARRKQ
jgi:hypothetical protein